MLLNQKQFLTPQNVLGLETHTFCTYSCAFLSRMPVTYWIERGALPTVSQLAVTGKHSTAKDAEAGDLARGKELISGSYNVKFKSSLVWLHRPNSQHLASDKLPLPFGASESRMQEDSILSSLHSLSVPTPGPRPEAETQRTFS